MKIAIALLCHKNTAQICSLIDSMDHENVCFFVHVDLKSQIDRSAIAGNNVFLLPRENCVDVQWGRFSMVEATLRLLDEIGRAEENFDFVWLMSGQDYPLHSAESIVRFIEQHENEDFIDILSDEKAESGGFHKRCQLFYYPFMMNRTIFSKIARKIYWAVTGGKRKTLFLKRKSPIEKFSFGSQWWLLSRRTIETIRTFLKHNSWYTEFFKNALVPDECFFQTLYRMLIGVEHANPSVCFVNWQGRSNSPAVLTCQDADRLKKLKSSYLIARKVDFEVDAQIADWMIRLE